MGAAAGDGLEGLETVVHQSYMVLSGDFENARDHAWALYADGTALRTPRIAFIDIDKTLSRDKWPAGWFEWRRSGGRIEVRASGGAGFAPLKGRVEPVRPAATGLRLSGDYTFVRTFGSMMMGNAGSVRNTYSFTPDGRYTISNSSFVGSGMTVGAGQTVVAAQCDEAGSRRQIATGNPVAPGGSTRGDGCGSANAGRYHVDGYAITLAADDGTIRRVGFYPVGKTDIMIDDTWYWRQGG